MKKVSFNISINILFAVLFAALFSLSFLFVVYWLPLQPFGYDFAFEDIGILLYLTLSGLSLAISFAMLFIKKLKTIAAGSIIFGVLLLIMFLPILYLGEVIRMQEFKKLAKKSEILVEAIKSFQANEKKLPNDLYDLVPKYLDEYPKTGMSAYPHYTFSVSSNGQEWSLIVPCSRGIFNWDEFFYNSNLNYQKELSITLIGNWAYYNE